MQYGMDESASSMGWNKWLKLPFCFSPKFHYKAKLQDGGGEHCSNGADIISELPDDILISIISKLTLQEAAAIPTLSTRWRHLRDTTTRLIFPPFLPDSRLVDDNHEERVHDIQDRIFPSYTMRINETLDSYKHGLELKEFRVHMRCLGGAPIERWLDFALSKEIEIIEIKMRYLLNATHGDYTLGLSDLLMKRKDSLPGLNTLKQLSLSLVHVDDGELELLISSFPLLESLSIEQSRRLKNVSIAGSASLKRLDISRAYEVESVQINNMSQLVSLRCYELAKEFALELDNVPELSEFVTSYRRHSTLANNLSRMPPSVRDQLRILKLETHNMIGGLNNVPIPQLINIKHLEVEVSMYNYPYFLYELLPLIEACCSLEKLELKLKWETFEKEFKSTFVPSRTKPLSKNLKTLKFSGYLGCDTPESGFVSIIIKNAAGLEEIVVEPHTQVNWKYKDDEEARKLIGKAATRAWQQLRPVTPLSVDLKIVGLSTWQNLLLFPLGVVLRSSRVVRDAINDVYSSIYCSDSFPYLRLIDQIGFINFVRLLPKILKSYDYKSD